MITMKKQPIEEVAVLEDREAHERLVRRERVREEIIEADDRDDQLGDDLRRAEPAELLAAVEHQLHAADAGGERQKAEPVELQMRLPLGLVHEHEQAEHGDDADRQG